MLRSSDRARRVLLPAAFALTACAELPPDYLSLAAQSPADRELQARRFDGIAEKELLQAAVGVLQDLGFAVETAGSDLGFLQGTMNREAKAPEQKALMLILGLLGASQGQPDLLLAPSREDQTVSVLLTLRPGRAQDPRSHLVLVSFHSHVRQPLARSAGPLRDPVLYRSFFELLSKAIFLQAHKL